jgi:LemA protein
VFCIIVISLERISYISIRIEERDNLKKLWIAVISIIVIVGILGALFAATYNGLVSADVAVSQQWSEVRNQYQRKYDLIPNLVEVTKDYMSYEAGLLVNLTKARTEWTNALSQSIDKQIAAGQGLDAVVGQWLATVENYPDLKASQVVLGLMDELSGSENRIAVARGRFIEATADYNRQVRSFPSNVVAGMFGFQLKDYYVGQEGIDNPIDVHL